MSLSPSGDRQTLLTKLKDFQSDLMKFAAQLAAADLGRRLAAGSAVNRLASWKLLAAGALRHELTTSEVERLIFDVPKGLYPGGLSGESRTRLVEFEIELRLEALGSAIDELERIGREWNGLGQLVVADTSFFLNHVDKIREVDFSELLEVEGTPIHLMLPMIIIDELDGLKQTSNSHARWRAGHTLGVVDEIYKQESTNNARWLHYQDEGFPETRLDIVPDPHGHVRLPINDDEIIDRALAIQYLAGRRVTLITYDTGQSTRARFQGLNVVKLTKPPEAEPSQPRKKK